MYESPIDAIVSEVQLAYEGEIMKAVQNCNIIVDKEELVKALNHDRDQYKKGYEDGKKSAQQWIPVSEGLPSDYGFDWVLAQIRENNGYLWIPQVMEYRKAKDDWYSNYEHLGWLKDHNGVFKVIAWMPLPKPYETETKGEKDNND